jgi:thymidylate synthase ThyX
MVKITSFEWRLAIVKVILLTLIHRPIVRYLQVSKCYILYFIAFNDLSKSHYFCVNIGWRHVDDKVSRTNEKFFKLDDLFQQIVDSRPTNSAEVKGYI